jgi:hypothetical protein
MQWSPLHYINRKHLCFFRGGENDQAATNIYEYEYYVNIRNSLHLFENVSIGMYKEKKKMMFEFI